MTDTTTVCVERVRKSFETLRARLALHAWTLEPRRGGTGYWATHLGRSRELVDLEAVESFAATVGAA